MVQRGRKMVQNRCGGALLTARGAPRRRGGVHFSPRELISSRRFGLPSARGAVFRRRVVQSGGGMVHFSYSGEISSGGSSGSGRKSLSWSFLGWRPPSWRARRAA